MVATVVTGWEGEGRSRQRRGCELRRRRGGEEGRCDPQQAHGHCFSEPDLSNAGSLLTDTILFSIPRVEKMGGVVVMAMHSGEFGRRKDSKVHTS